MTFSKGSVSSYGCTPASSHLIAQKAWDGKTKSIPSEVLTVTWEKVVPLLEKL